MDYPAYSEELFYDRAGNRTRRLVAGEEELYRYDPRNRLMAYTKNGVTTMFQYDNAGNLLVDDKARYSYDAFNRTTRVETFDGNVQVNRYDAEGLRYEMEENGNLVQFIFNQEREVVTKEESTGLTRLIRSTELIARSSDGESARTYYHYASDEMGSATHIVDENGNVQNRYEYDAWGNFTAQEEIVPNRFTYYGQQIDPITQQYYLRARFYNPVIGRFTQEDTYRGDGLNLYAYCANNPVYYVDPSGLDKDALHRVYGVDAIYEKFTPDEIELLKSTVINEGQMLKDIGLTNNQLGPAIAGVYNKATGKIYTAINSMDGSLSKELHPFIAERIANMPDDVFLSYNKYTHGAGSHAEVYAVNKALLDGENVRINHLIS